MPIGFAIIVGILVNCIWGTAFLIPYYLSAVDATAIALCRYLIYGLISVCLVCINRRGRQRLTPHQWRVAFVFAFTGSVGYYAFLTSAIHYDGITLAALIVGILPITMIVVGNILERRFNFRQLALPIGFISVGIVLLNISKLGQLGVIGVSENGLLGLIFSVIALLLWTTYGVYNALFLKKNPMITAKTWSEAIGICCLIQGAIGMVALMLFKPTALQNIVDAKLLLPFFIGCIFLGGVASWLATIGWNLVSRHLSIAITGQLIVFETMSSLAYGYIVDQTFPSHSELFSAVLIIFGVYLGIRLSTAKRSPDTRSNSAQEA